MQSSLREVNRTLRENHFVVSESFYIFVAEFRNKLKKGGNGKQNDSNSDEVKL